MCVTAAAGPGSSCRGGWVKKGWSGTVEDVAIREFRGWTRGVCVCVVREYVRGYVREQDRGESEELRWCMLNSS